MKVFPDAKTWSAWMRRTLLRLPGADAGIIAVARRPPAPTAAQLPVPDGDVRPWLPQIALFGERRVLILGN